MTGEQLAKLMVNGALKRALAKHARRYSKRVEDQEEYIQDAWLRISEQPGDRTLEWYEEQGRKAVLSAYHRNYYPKRVCKDEGKNTNGNSKGKDPRPKDAVGLGRGRFVDKKAERLNSWYYDGEWEKWVRVVHIDGRVSWLPKERFVFDETEHRSYRDCEKSDSRKWRVNRVAVTKLSQVKNDEDWEEYIYRKEMETHERLRIQSGIGPGAHRLPDSGDSPVRKHFDSSEQ